MNLEFYKYQGTGNDFVMIDNRSSFFPKENKELINKLCDRNFGVGGDGLILLENDANTDFRMVYFNADGNQSTMCGNGGRCIVAFANQLNVIKNQTTFIAIDGLHHATIENGIVSLQMIDVNEVKNENGFVFTDTGSPHHVELVENIGSFDVYNKGKQIRNNVYGSEGSNVNFVEQLNSNSFRIRTYERGVEDETLACGTGATAAAIAMHKTNKTEATDINIQVEGGQLSISFDVQDNKYKNVFLKGPAEFVFKGQIEI
ncbi:diaminopimelate epimerase [Tenacibaculum sp. MEBiC06402]|uniref:diaminopimelate epimerase n=1 Tax=unclassified Tenacibaculum TaxID=2635139 RepID=UPI003B9B0D3E